MAKIRYFPSLRKLSIHYINIEFVKRSVARKKKKKELNLMGRYFIRVRAIVDKNSHLDDLHTRLIFENCTLEYLR